MTGRSRPASIARWTRSEMDTGPSSSVAGSGAGAGNSGDASSGLSAGMSRSASSKLLQLTFMIINPGRAPVTTTCLFRIQDVHYFSLFPYFRLCAGLAVGDEGGPQGGVAAGPCRGRLRQWRGLVLRGAQSGLAQFF